MLNLLQCVVCEQDVKVDGSCGCVVTVGPAFLELGYDPYDSGPSRKSVPTDVADQALFDVGVLCLMVLLANEDHWFTKH